MDAHHRVLVLLVVSAFQKEVFPRRGHTAEGNNKCLLLVGIPLNCWVSVN